MKSIPLYLLILVVAVSALIVPPLSAQDATTCEAGFRVIEHAAGTDCIPETVQRVAVFDTGATELMLALNRPPVIKSVFLEQFQLAVLPDLQEDFTALTGDLPDMGFPINQEALLSANPDVIITNADFAPLFPENIETIAPLVVLERDWKSKLLKTAEVLGEVDATQALLDAYASRVETLRGLMAEDSEIHLSLVRIQNEDFIIYLPGTFAVNILSEVGILTPQAQLDLMGNETDNEYYYPSRERLDLLNGDLIFLFIAYPDPEINAASQKLLDSLADNALFQSLSAAQNEDVYQVDGYWYGDGIFSAHKVLDDLFTIIAEVDPAEFAPNPLATGAVEPAPEATEAP